MNQTPQRPGEPEKEQLAEGTLVSHLLELRSRLIKSTVAVALVFACIVPFTQEVFTIVATPLMRQLPEGATMIATQVASPFLTPFKLSLFVALFIAMPAVLYQAWAFVAPGLYKREKRFAVPMLVMSIVLFYIGIAFAYYFVFPLMFGFFATFSPAGVTMMTDISSYLDFVLTIFLAFGVAFEVPVATVLLVWTGLVSVESLVTSRPYVFLGAFVVGMFLTPPDVFSQTLLAVPMYLLYELGIFMARTMTRQDNPTVETDSP